MRRLALFLPALLAACTTFPAIDAVVPAADRRAAPPALVPLAPLLAQAEASSGVDPVAVSRDVNARIAALRARAARLAGPVIEPATRARMLRSFR